MAVIERTDREEIRESLRRWLNKKLPEASDLKVSALEAPSTSGFSNQTIFFDAEWREGDNVCSERMVARLECEGHGLYLDYDIGNQYAVMAALEKQEGIAVPKMLWMEEDSSILGTRFFAMTRAEGRVPADDPPFTAEGWVLALAPEDRARLCDNGLRVLSLIHSLDPSTLGLEFLSRPRLGSTPLDQEIAYYKRYYEWAAEGHHYPTVEAGFRWVQTHRPTEPEPIVLNWGDARIGNMMFAPDMSVAAVFDWEMASFGSPEKDLGWWLFMHRHHTEGFGLPHPDGFPSREETIARYEELSGHVVRYAHFYEAFAALRGAVIMIRLARLMIDAGLLPADHGMAENNGSSRILAALLGLPAPAGEGIRLISKN